MPRFTTVEVNPAGGRPVGQPLQDPESHGANSLQHGENTRSISRRILDIIFEYALNKFDDSRDRLENGADTFLGVIDQFVAARKRVETCLPAFPFKSANKVYKVLGSLPDKAEELALGRLNSMCTRIGEVYGPGAHVTIISDGITYNGTVIVICLATGNQFDSQDFSHILTPDS
jgi:pyoverdine/dityrosine biosynthesis protein Dit1